MSNQNINSDNNNTSNNTFINLLQELIELDNTQQDIENLIPCEFCNHSIHINNYERHSIVCYERFQLRNRMYMNMINRRRDREILQESNNNNILDNNLNTSLNYASVNNSDSDDDESYYNIDDSVEMDGIEGLASDNELDNLQSNNDFEDYINLNSIENNEENTNQEDNHENNDDTSSDDLLQDLPDLIETNTNNTNNTNNTRTTRNIENTHLLYVDIMRDRIYNNNSFRTMLRTIVDNNRTESSEYSSLFANNNFERLMDTITNSIIRVPRIPLDFNKIFTNIDKKDLDSNEECPICYESMNELNDDNNIVKILCNHKFCKKCISEWLNTNDYCPMCKKNMRDMTITKEDDMDIENYIEENDNTIS